MARTSKLDQIETDAHIRAWIGRREHGTENTGKNAGKPCGPIRRLLDGGGLYLLDVAGKKPGWRLDYRFHCPVKGHEVGKTLSLGVYPHVLLSTARKKAVEMRQQIELGTDPGEQREEKREADKKAKDEAREDAQRIKEGKPLSGTFEDTAEKLAAFKLKAGKFQQGSHNEFMRMVRKNFPGIRLRRMERITVEDLKAELDAYKNPNAEGVTREHTAVDMLAMARDIFWYGRTQLKVCKHNIALELIEDKYVTRPAGSNNPQLDNQKRLGELWQKAWDKFHNGGEDGGLRTNQYKINAAAVLAQIIMFQRSSATCGMRWDELTAGTTPGTFVTWTIPPEKRGRKLQTHKQKLANGAPRNHVIHLPKQMRVILAHLHKLTGHLEHVFVARLDGKDKPIDRTTLLSGIRQLGFTADEITAHGLRGTAQTMFNEETDGVHNKAMEAQLTHTEKDSQLADTYNKATYVKQRRAMLQLWCNYLDSLVNGEWAAKQAERDAAELAELEAEIVEPSNVVPFLKVA